MLDDEKDCEKYLRRIENFISGIRFRFWSAVIIFLGTYFYFSDNAKEHVKNFLIYSQWNLNYIYEYMQQWIQGLFN